MFLRQQKISLQRDKLSSSWYMDRHSRPPLPPSMPPWEGSLSASLVNDFQCGRFSLYIVHYHLVHLCKECFQESLHHFLLQHCPVDSFSKQNDLISQSINQLTNLLAQPTNRSINQSKTVSFNNCNHVGRTVDVSKELTLCVPVPVN